MHPVLISNMPNPVLINMTRGSVVESFHRGAVCIVRAEGEPVVALGDIDRPIYPRSAIKVLQALPLMESGAADAADFTDTELALACASHSGEEVHVETVRDHRRCPGAHNAHRAPVKTLHQTPAGQIDEDRIWHVGDQDRMHAENGNWPLYTVQSRL